MKTNFTKYTCQGNDFLLFDLMKDQSSAGQEFSVPLVKSLCDRKMGIGADGVLVMTPVDTADFRMTYYNADGNEVEMCGNGSRAMVSHYFRHHGDDKKSEVSFLTLNGLYHGAIGENDLVKVQMTEIDKTQLDLVKDYEKKIGSKKSFYLKVGVPHVLFEVDQLDAIDLETWGREVRYDERFAQGTNVNFFTVLDTGHLQMRTYERGVEGETLACGTGATALAEVYRQHYENKSVVKIELAGGTVLLEKDTQDRRFLCGQVTRVFEGLYFPDAIGLK